MPTSVAARAVVLDERLRLLRGRARAAARSPRACRRRGPPRPRALEQPLDARRRRGTGARRRRRASRPMLARASRRAPRPAPSCAGSRRGRSPSRASSASEPLADQLDHQVVRDELAARRGSARRAGRARSRAAIAARSMSPVDDVRDARTRRRSASPACPCRPPAGRGQDVQRQAHFEEALVGAHHHLRLHLPHRVERDADDDQHRRAAERAGGRLREAAVADEERRQRRDERQVERAGQRQPREHAVEVLRGRRARDGCPGCSRRTCAGCRPGRPG